MVVGGACGLPSHEAEVLHTKNTVLNIATALERARRSSTWTTILENLAHVIATPASASEWQDKLSRVVERILVDVFPRDAKLNINHAHGHFYVHAEPAALPDPTTVLCPRTHSRNMMKTPSRCNMLVMSGCLVQQTLEKIDKKRAGLCGRFLTYLVNFCGSLKSMVDGSYVTNSGARIFNCALILDALKGVNGFMEPKARHWVVKAKEMDIVGRFQELVLAVSK
jgi:hypothetical protein